LAGSGVVPDGVVADLLAPPVDGTSAAAAAALRRDVASVGAVTPDRGDAPGSAASDAEAIPARSAKAASRALTPENGAGSGADELSPLRHVVRMPARAGQTAHWPTWVPAPIRDTLVDHGVRAPWTHQAQAAELAHAGQDVVVATGTASGKSLDYHLPVRTALAAAPRATALYLSPTKALAADQLRALAELDLTDARPPPLHGDTHLADRHGARRT